MAVPVVGVIGNAHLLEGRMNVQATGERNLYAIADVCKALPLIFPATLRATDVGALLDVVDGILLTGGRANVHPTRFGFEPHTAHEPYDENRDDVALPVVLACVERKIPIFGICRGIQEINVAMGGTLHPEVSDLPGRLNHRAPRLESGEMHPDPQVIFADRHNVALTPGGMLAKMIGREIIRVNSLHGQAIQELGERIVIEGVAEDETIEAISIADSEAFTMGVQWHAEYDPQTNPINRVLFESFGAAVNKSNRNSITK